MFKKSYVYKKCNILYKDAFNRRYKFQSIISIRGYHDLCVVFYTLEI